jgi:sodium/proline symporter
MDAHMLIVTVSFAVYSVLIVGIGLYSARYARRSDEDYFLAGRGLPSWLAALSASASSESGWVTMGLVGWAFTEGVRAYWIIPGCLVGFWFNWFVLARRLCRESRASGALTVPDYFALRFRERLPLVRVLSVIVILVAMVLYVAAQFAAAGKAFDAGLHIDYRVGVLIGAAIVLVYTVTGGFRAVCWTDFLQGLLMVVTLVFFPVYLVIQLGGYGPILDGLRSLEGGNLVRFTPDKAGPAFVGFLLGSGALGINFGFPGQPHVLVRFMALRSEREARLGGIIAMTWGFCIYWGAVTVGLIARLMATRGFGWAEEMLEKPDIYGEMGLVLSANYMLYGVLAGLVLAAVLAAICSTADSQLVVAASAVASDVYSRLVEKGRRRFHGLINKATVFVLGVIAVALVFDEDIRVYKYVLTYGWAILGASFAPQIILALFWKRASYAGCLAGMITGFLVALIWPRVYDPGPDGIEIYNLPLAFAAALIVNIAASLIAPDTKRPQDPADEK